MEGGRLRRVAVTERVAREVTVKNDNVKDLGK